MFGSQFFASDYFGAALVTGDSAPRQDKFAVLYRDDQARRFAIRRDDEDVLTLLMVINVA